MLQALFEVGYLLWPQTLVVAGVGDEMLPARLGKTLSVNAHPLAARSFRISCLIRRGSLIGPAVAYERARGSLTHIRRRPH